MNWLTFTVLGGGMILLGLAIVFLLFAEIARKAQETSRRERRESALRARLAANNDAFDPESPRSVRHRPEVEVSAQEKSALQNSGTEKPTASGPSPESSVTPEKSRSTLQ